ncbi:uncharacterized protein LOC142947445 [Anarhichas minor]|uniref:uncharacterized protein LOC142947445 n=1 Tax=Anarhichas minor TaxID=65739 RepID=UPI003F741F2F
MSLADQQWCPTSVQVAVHQARGLRVKGKSGTNDAYAVMQVGKEKFQTSVVEKSVAPVWGEEAAFDLPPLLLLHQDGGGGKERGTLHVHVLHRALVGPDKPLGQAVVNLLQLCEDETRNKTEWFKLLDKTGKADKDRGEVLLDIQFMRNNMTASMFDLSATGKSRSRLGKFKDKVRGKKKDSDTASNVVPSFTQVLTDSDEEGDGEVAAGKGDKKKKHKMKSLFSHKSNLQKNMSQSMTVLTAKNISLSGSQSSGLNVDSSEGKKKFKFLIHKRSNSSDGKDAASGNQKQGAAEQSNVCINGSHVYRDEPPPRASRTSSNFSLTSSGHGSMEDVPESFPSAVDSLRAVRQYSPWTEEEEEELENTKEDVGQLRREEEEKIRMEEEMRREEEELERLADEKRQEEERRTEEENVKREEEEKIRREEEERRRHEEERVKREQEERERLAEQKRRLQEQERIEEERVRKEEEERVLEERVRKEEEERVLEERVRKEEEERVLEERVRKEEEERVLEERVRKEEEERVLEESVRKEEEERVLEERRRKEDEMVRRQEEEREEKRIAEQERMRKEEEEKIRMEEERAREERMGQEEEERVTRQEEEERVTRQEERKLAEEKRRQEEEDKRIRMEEEMAEEERRRDEEEMRQNEKLEEQEQRQREHEERIKKEEEKARKEKEECERLVEEERIEAEEKIRRKEEERIRVAEEKREKEEERVRRQEEEREQLAEETRILEEQRRIEKEREKRRLEERVRKEKEEYDRLVVEKMRQQEQERRKIEEEEKIKMEEEERIRREEKAQRERKEEARKLEKEKLTREAEELKRDKKTKHKTVGKKPTVESPAEVISNNPFDENFSNNPFEEIPDSPAGPDSRTTKGPTVQQRVQSAAPSVGSKPVSSDEKDPVNAQRERRPAPQPPGRNPAERQSQREQDGATQHLAQINKKSKDKDIKTVSVLPQRLVQMIAPLSRSPTETMNNQSLTQSCAAKDASNLAKHGKCTAPPRPRSVEEGPSSDQKTAPSSDDNIPHECGSEAKQASSVYGLNPFEDDENAAQDDSTTSGNTGSVHWPPVGSQAADKDAASQTKIKSSKARAPQLPAKIAATSSTSINQNTEGGRGTGGTGVTVTGVTHTCDPASEAAGPVRVQEAPLQESQPAPVQSAGEDAGGKKVGPPKTSRRLQPVKPLNPLEQQSVSVVKGVKDNSSAGILCDVQVKTKVDDTGLKGPYSQLTQGELISLVLKQEKQLSARDKKISELEQYIDNLLVRVIEEKPSILLSLNPLKKAA